MKVDRESDKRKRELYIIVVALSAVLFLTYLQTYIFNLGPGLPIASSILIFALININLLLLLLIIFLVMRNLVKLIFERKRRIFGSRLRTRLVVAFVTLSLVPTILLFLVAIKFIASGIEYWFTARIEQSLEESLEVGRAYYNQLKDKILDHGRGISSIISQENLLHDDHKKDLQRFIAIKCEEYNLASIEVFSPQLSLIAEVQNLKVDTQKFGDPLSLIKENPSNGGVSIKSSSNAELVVGFMPIKAGEEPANIIGWVVINSFVPKPLMGKMDGIVRGVEEYSQLKMLKKHIKIGHLIILSIVTLLIIFSATWFGFYLAKGITIPIQELAAGTHKIAEGDLDVHIDRGGRDEIGFLVNSFNRMAQDLKASQQEIETTNEELRKINREIEQRRKYMEIVLRNVSAGVVAIDAHDRIQSVNKSIERMLRLNTGKILNRNYREVLRPEHLQIADNFLEALRLRNRDTVEREVRLSIDNKDLTLLVNVTVLKDEDNKKLGMVVVFHDLTELERAQRVSAWREVAKRIAHEVKNPLTPIRLSAQRLRKHYKNILAHDGKIFDECTKTIVDQVDQMMRLVNEFSNFARLPAVNLKPTDLAKIIDETLLLYRGAHRNIDFKLVKTNGIPIFKLDGEQMKRVVINLLDNAVDSIKHHGAVAVVLSHDPILRSVRMEVQDTGSGISPEDKARLFEPYFSTKKGGMGLGLAIVSAIVSDHHGFIRVRDNEPKGTSFIVELPVET